MRAWSRADFHTAAPVRATGNRLHAPATDLDPRIVIAFPLEIAAAADRPQHTLQEHLRQRPLEEVKQRQRQLVDAHVVVFPVAARLTQPTKLTFLTRGWLGVVRHVPVVLHLVGHAETLALPFAGLCEEVLPRDHAVVR